MLPSQPSNSKLFLNLFYFSHLVDEFCKDSLEIIDTESKRSLWRGCSELTRLVQVPSLSHQIEVRWNSEIDIRECTKMDFLSSFLSPPFLYATLCNITKLHKHALAPCRLFSGPSLRTFFQRGDS